MFKWLSLFLHTYGFVTQLAKNIFDLLIRSWKRKKYDYMTIYVMQFSLNWLTFIICWQIVIYQKKIKDRTLGRNAWRCVSNEGCRQTQKNVQTNIKQGQNMCRDLGMQVKITHLLPLTILYRRGEELKVPDHMLLISVF